jgi:hypothetical protein
VEYDRSRFSHQLWFLLHEISYTKGGINMRVMERGGGYNKETNYQVVPKALRTTSFVPPTAGVNALLETARRKKAYAIRGI